MYKLEFTDKAVKQLRKLDKGSRKLILTWIANNLENCENPRIKGKGLIANRSGEWRYRVGDYRIICCIEDKELIILALSIAHQRSVY